MAVLGVSRSPSCRGASVAEPKTGTSYFRRLPTEIHLQFGLQLLAWMCGQQLTSKTQDKQRNGTSAAQPTTQKGVPAGCVNAVQERHFETFKILRSADALEACDFLQRRLDRAGLRFAVCPGTGSDINIFQRALHPNLLVTISSCRYPFVFFPRCGWVATGFPTRQPTLCRQPSQLKRFL